MKPVFLIDLGGVLIDLNWIESAKRIFGASETKDLLLKKWLNLQSVRNFETGTIGFDEFSIEFANEISAPISQSEIKEAFLNIIGDVKPNCESTIIKLKQIGTVAMLSNTNSIHIEKLMSETEIFNLFNHIYLSYELKCVKPDKEIFEAVIADLKCQASDIYFFDDSMTNINGAKSLGINAFQVNSPDEILAVATKLFTLPS